MQSHKLGEAMFDEDDIFCPPSFDEQIYYDDSMPATYDAYCDETYAIKSSDDYIYKTCHDYDYPFSEYYSFNVETIYSILVSYDTPTILKEKNFAYVESNKNSMLYVMVILLNSFMMLLKIIMREEYMLVGIAIISSFLSMCLKF